MLYFLLGTGYVGLALLAQDSGMECKFIATTTTEAKLEDLNSYKKTEKSVLLDASDKNSLRDYLAHCDGVIITVAPKDGASYESTYLKTAMAVKEALSERDSPFYLLYTSSTSVYGDHQGEWVNEDSPCLTESAEGKILLETENCYLSCKNSWVTPCILRLGGIHGPGRDLDSRAQRLSGKELPGTGQEPTNSTHLEEILKAIEFCCENRLEGIYNVVSTEHPSRKELYETLCTRMGLPAPIWTGEGASLHGSNCKVSVARLIEAGFHLGITH